jgi:predicted alpha-1,2-mannosidase
MRTPRHAPALVLLLALTACSDGSSSADADDAPDAVVADTALDVSTPDAVDAHDASEAELGPPLETVDVVGRADPFLGSDGPGNVFVGALVPHGMAKVGPDSLAEVGEIDSYDWGRSHVHGFSHTHLNGPGGSAYGYSHLRLLPARQSPPPPPLDAAAATRLDHALEQGTPGYYAADLPELDTRWELTATAHCGVHRVTFSGDGPRVITLDPGTLRGRNLTADLEAADGTVEGYGTILAHPVLAEVLKAGAPGTSTRTLFFTAAFEPPFDAVGAFEDGAPTPGQAQASGKDAALWLEWAGTAELTVEVRVCLSAIDGAQARANAEAEAAAASFDEVRAATEGAWNTLLNRLTVEGGSDAQRRQFATALAHAHYQPTDADEGGRHWTGYDQEGRVLPSVDGAYYTDDFCQWDTFRTTHPLQTLTEPERRSAMLASLLEAYQVGGWLDVCSWQGAGYSRIMIGNPTIPILVDAFRKGFAPADPELALTAMVHQSTECENPIPSGGCGYVELGTVPEYVERGWVPHECDPTEAASMTLEYAHDDWCLARYAEALGHADVQASFDARAGNWKNHWDPVTGYMRARKKNGAWVEPFDPGYNGPVTGFCESSAFTYTWFVPHDVPGLVQAMGGADAFNAKLDAYFDGGFFDPSNEPGFHTPYLYAHAGRPDQTQARVRKVLDSAYSEAPNGLPGNDDAGATSAWFVFSALGLYPVTPGDPVYTLGSPLFERAILRLDPEGRRRFVVEAPGNAPDAPYVQSAELDGRPLTAPFLTHAQLVAGGTLVLHMGSTPSSWGRPAAD